MAPWDPLITNLASGIGLVFEVLREREKRKVKKAEETDKGKGCTVRVDVSIFWAEEEDEGEGEEDKEEGMGKRRNRLSDPVVVPQRRPGWKNRGFLLAYAPVLEERCGIGEEEFLEFLEGFNKGRKVSFLFCFFLSLTTPRGGESRNWRGIIERTLC